MTAPTRRRVIAWVIFTIVLGVLHAVLKHHLASLDPIAAFLLHRGVEVVATALPLLASRLTLFFVVPAWGAALAVRVLVERARKNDAAD